MNISRPVKQVIKDVKQIDIYNTLVKFSVGYPYNNVKFTFFGHLLSHESKAMKNDQIHRA